MKSFCKSIVLLFSLQVGALNAHIEEIGLPNLEERSADVLSLKNEKQIGELIMQKIHGQNAYVADTVVNEYLQQIANRLNRYANVQDFKLHFFGVQSDDLNAFAFFGAHVAFHTGLLMAVERESELAAVLAHETSHITQRHLARMLSNNKKMMPVTFIELLAAAAIGMAAPEAGAHLATAALAGHVQQLINYTRDHEYEADRIGIELLAKAGFDPKAMATVFHRMHQGTRYQTRPPEYLMTHPLFGTRIADAQNRASHFPANPVEDSLSFHFVRIRIEATKWGNSKNHLRQLQKVYNNTQFKNADLANYAKAIVLLKGDKPLEAKNLIEPLAEKYKEEWIPKFTLTECYHEMHDTEKELDSLKKLVDIYPENQAIILQYADALVSAQKNLEGKTILLKAKNVLNNPVAYQLLAKANGQLKDQKDLHMAQAEFHYSRGEYIEAFRQLEIAKEYVAKNPSAISSIMYRKKQMQKMFDLSKKM